MDTKEKRRKVISYLMMGMGIEKPDVTPQIVAMFASIPLKVLARPVILRMRNEGKTQQQISIMLGIPIRSIQYIDQSFVQKNDTE